MYNHPYDSYDPQCTNTKPPWTSEQSQTSRLHSSRRRTTTLPAVTWTMSLWPSKVNASLKVSWRIFWYQQGIGQVNQQSSCYNISYTILDTEEYKHSIVPIDQQKLNFCSFWDPSQAEKTGGVQQRSNPMVFLTASVHQWQREVQLAGRPIDDCKRRV